MAIIDESTRRQPGTAPASRASDPSIWLPVALTAIAALAAIVLFGVLDPRVVTNTALLSAFLAGVLLAVAAVPRERALPVAGALVAGWLALAGLYAIARKLDFGLSVDQAVGGGTFFDTAYVPAQIASGLALLIAFGPAWLVTRRFGPAVAGVAQRRAASTGPRLRRPETVVALATAAIALTLFPDLWTPLRSLGPVAPQWDVANIFAWNAFLERGLQPVSDFFYPYGHVALFSATPWGGIWLWVTHCFLLGVAAWALWRLSGGSVARTIAGVLTIAVLLLGWSTLERYLPGLLIAAAYAALDPLSSRRFTRGHLIFGAIALYTTWLEPDVLLIGLAGIACVIAGELVAGRLRAPVGDLARRLLVDLAPLALIALVPLLWLLEGTWDGNTRFWSALRATSAASSRDELTLGALTGQTLLPKQTMVVVAAPLLLLISGLVIARVRGSRTRAASMLLLAAAGATEVMLLKHLVRDAGNYVLLIAFPLLTWAAILLWSRRVAALAATVGVFAGVLFVALQQERIVTRYADAAIGAPVHLARDVRLPTQDAAVNRAERARFAPERFANWPDAAIAAELRQAMGFSNVKTWGLVGDSPMLYVVMDARPQYHSELYDASRIEEQRLFVNDLARRKPKFLVYRRDLLQDGIPQSVRSPLIFDYMVRNYVPFTTGDAWDILVRRDPSRPIDERYWRSRLDTLFLGYLPAHSGAGGAARCTSGAGCAEYAMLKGHATRRGEQVLLRVTGPDGHAFGVVVVTKPGEDTYPVRLDRLWFASLVGPNPQVAVQQPTAGWSVDVEGRKTDALY